MSLFKFSNKQTLLIQTGLNVPLHDRSGIDRQKNTCIGQVNLWYTCLNCLTFPFIVLQLCDLTCVIEIQLSPLFHSETVGYAFRWEDGGKFVCLGCGKKFNHKHDAIRHIKNIHTPQPQSACHICQKVFKTPHYRDDHLRNKHGITQKMMRGGSYQNHVV